MPTQVLKNQPPDLKPNTLTVRYSIWYMRRRDTHEICEILTISYQALQVKQEAQIPLSNMASARRPKALKIDVFDYPTVV